MLEGLILAGRHGHEGGALWLGRRADEAVVKTVVLPSGKGVMESPGFWQLSTEVYGQVGTWASQREEVLLALVHSHRGPKDVWLSATDQFATVHVIDFLSIVVGGYGRVADPNSWGYHIFNGKAFERLDDGIVARRVRWTDDEIAVLHADSDSVEARS
jgi:hypothetical protein